METPLKLINGDCCNLLTELETESVDCIVTDCPYRIVSGGVSTGKQSACWKPKGCGRCFVKRETKGQLENYENLKSGKMFSTNEIEFFEWLPECFRVLKEGGHAYIMINARNLKDLQTEAEKAGFKFQQLLIWDKQGTVPNKWYLNCFERILMLRKGKAVPIKNLGSKNLISVHRLMGKEKSHPTEKPVELMKILIENSTNEGEVVLDPFMGTGATGVAALSLGRKFIGCEIDRVYYDIADERIIANTEEWSEKKNNA